jgi:hypothetical protein
MRRLIMLLVGAGLLAGCQRPAAPQSDMAGMDHGDPAVSKLPMIMTGYGAGGFPITTRVPQAQAFFDNGMQLGHAFAHKAAIRAMAQAVRLDRGCAMCQWGLAWAAGPTINFGKNDEQYAALAKITERAAALAAKNATPRERAMIDALRLRYAKGDKALDALNFAKAMQAMSAREPGDNELGVLAADAWLQTAPKKSPEEKRNAQVAMSLLEPVLKRAPEYSPAIHFYIHATEMAGVPILAEPYADRLAKLAPQASHLIHMPSHTYYLVGRYQDAADANMRAVELGIQNAKALGMPPPDGVWGLPYHMHNVSFGLGGALEAGDARGALALGRPLVWRSQRQIKAPIDMQMVAANGYYAMARFANPSEVLALPVPVLPLFKATWHYARGEAYSRLGRVNGVRAEAAAIEGMGGAQSKDDGGPQAQQLIMIARGVLTGRAAMMEHRFKDAAVAFRQAAQLEESAEFSLVSDPPGWYYPVRRDLAAALLASGDRAGARKEAAGALDYRKKDPGTLALLAGLDAKQATR